MIQLPNRCDVTELKVSPKNWDTKSFSEKDWLGFINLEGDLAIPIKFDYARGFNNGFAEVPMFEGYFDKYGYIDQNGNQVIPFLFDDAFPFLFDGKFATVKINSKWGIINRKGNQLVPCIYDELDYFHDGFAKFKINSAWGYIDKTGKVALEAIYDEAEAFIDGIAKVKFNGQYGYINKEGKQYWED